MNRARFVRIEDRSLLTAFVLFAWAVSSCCMPRTASATGRDSVIVGLDTLAARGDLPRIGTPGARPGDRSQSFGLAAHGLDLDDDYATILAGFPMSRPTHAHGETDVELGPIIPELVSATRLRVGPSFVEDGDLASAGTTVIRYRSSLPAPLLVASGGQEDYRRILAARSAAIPAGVVMGALELEQRDGPWSNPEDNHKTNVLVRYGTGADGGNLEVTAMGYDDRWHATNSVPDRSIAAGRLGRFGAIDPSDGGTTNRFGISADYVDVGDQGVTRLSGYVFKYGLDLFSDFTYFLSDTAHGDQVEQTDRRWVAGLRAARSVTDDWFAASVVQTIGVDFRHDQIAALGIYHTQSRNRLSTLREDRGRITSLSPYVESDATWMRGIRAVLGARVEGLAFDDEASTSSLSGSGVDGTVSPKAALLLGPWDGVEFHASSGFGVHSEDMRGASGSTGSPVTPSQGVEQAPDHIPTSGGPSTRTTPLLIHTRGAEVGARYAHGARASLAVSCWRMDIEAEHVSLGDQVSPSQSRPSRRTGIDLSAETRPWDAVIVGVAASFARARFTDGAPAGEFIPGATEGVGTASVEYARARGPFAGLQVRYRGPSPLTQDDSIRAPGGTLLDLRAGFRAGPRWSAEIVVDNCLDRSVDELDHYYVSRLPNEPLSGVADWHRHPEWPRSVRLAVQWGPSL